MTIVLYQAAYLGAAVLFAALAIAAATRWRARYDGFALAFGTVSTTAWCGIIGVSQWTGEISSTWMFVAELVTDIAWLNFIGSLFRGAIMPSSFNVIRYGGVVTGVVAVVLGVAGEAWGIAPVAVAPTALVAGSILMSMTGLVALEQVYRNSRESHRRDLRYLCLGLASLFAVDLLLYSNAVLAGQIAGLFWDIRGFVVAIAAILLARALALRDTAAPSVFVSRRVVLHAASIAVIGGYLIVAGIAGQIVRYYGREWGDAAQAVLLYAALVAVLLLILSDRYRNTLRVFVAKHFFEGRYDYREEWRRLIGTLTERESELPLAKRATRAILNILGSDAGVLWQRAESGDFTAVSSWNQPAPDDVIAADDRFLDFLQRKLWIVNLDELREESGHYEGLEPADVPAGFAGGWVVVPLVHDDAVCGLIVATPPRSKRQLNFEDHDLLRTAGLQVASYLEQDRATTKLAENLQFEAFSRLTAYLMHDLKNTMAQQTLIVENAEKHKRNPEFVDDVIDTVRSGAERIRNVIRQLQQASTARRRDKINVGKALLRASQQCLKGTPEPNVRPGDFKTIVLGDEERLVMAVTHALTNAQNATPDDGQIDVSLAVEDGECVVTIADTGRGMDAAFIRDRLFKPFDSTKGAEGMGIGAHQIRETLREMGGSVEVESEPDKGTTFWLRMPLAATGQD
ncbi:MAG: PEP-CTERM system histidine kinase PrsK [Woeseiaceae bacterium]|nr:PEP-CTERM system histidine kinase PrsK [Woeseiaceae bacterium]